MTKEELKQHCEKQVKMCEEWAKGNGREPSGKIYEEHKLILELLEENEDFQNYIDKANHTNSQLIQIIERHKMQQPSEDCVSRKAVIEQARDYGSETFLIPVNSVKDLPPVTPTQSWIPVSERLPEDRNIVLVTAYWHETYQVMMASYFGEGLWWCVPFNNCGDHMQKLNPKAWQPLPQPYKEKRGDSDDSN